MSESALPRATVVVNPAKVDVATLRRVVEAEESRSGWAPSTWLETDAADFGRAAAEAAVNSKPNLILIVGGDGTLRSAAALAASDIPFALIPVGTANNFARELRLPLNRLAASVSIAFTGVDRPIDIGEALLEREDGSTSRHAFLVMAGVGVDAQMAANASVRAKSRVGWLAYVDPIARSILGNKQFDVSFSLDAAAEEHTRAHTFIVGNSGYLPGGMLLLPNAAVDDGLLDAVIFRPGRGAGWGVIGYRVLFNQWLHRTRFGQFVGRLSPTPNAIRWSQAKHVTVRLPVPQELQLDGDPQGLVVAATLSVRPHSLVIRVPR